MQPNRKIMKKILLIIVILIGLIGCKHDTVIHTYYGDFDTDTLNIEMIDANDQPCYKVYKIDKDSFIWYGVVKYLPSPATILYNPKDKIYYRLSRDNNGRETCSEYNPVTKNLEWLDD